MSQPSSPLTVATEIRLTATTFRPNTRRIVSDSRLALPVQSFAPGINGVTDCIVTLDQGPRGLGPVNNLLYLEGTGPFILETAHLDHENPSVLKVVRTPIQRLYLAYCQLIGVSLLPAGDDPDQRRVQVRAYFS